MKAHWQKLRTFFFLALTLLPALARGDNVATAFNAANHLFEQQKFSEAAAAYEKLIQTGNISDALYFNLGNAYFKAGQTGRAIAAYRNAQKLAPRDPNVEANLQFAREEVQNSKAPAESVWAKFLTRLTLNEWAIIASSFIWLWFLLLAFGQLKPDWRKLVRGYAIALGVLAVFFIGCTAFAAKKQLVKAAVVTAQEAVVRRGPFDESQSAFTLRDGAELTVTDQRDNWLQVVDTANRTGWIATNEVALVR